MCLFAEAEYATLMVVTALVVIIGVLLLRSHRYFSRQERDSSPIVRVGRPDAEDRGHHAEAPEVMQRWEVQMHEVARDLFGQLDSKMGALEQLIREADRASARLEAALSAAREEEGRSAPNAASTTLHGEQPLREATAAGPALTNQAEKLKSAGLEDQGSRGQTTGTEEVSEEVSRERRYEEIYLLADYGFDAAGIAQRVGSPIGEVELILSLRDKR